MRDWSVFLNREIPCECGRVHSCFMDGIHIGEDVFESLRQCLVKGHYDRVLVVADCNTVQCGGEVFESLDRAGVYYTKLILEAEGLLPDERAVGRVLMEVPEGCDLLLGIGSGTINDVCKFVSFRLKIDFYMAATAPSMDGYSSGVAAMITDGLKVTYEVGRPKRIFGDLRLLSAAPMSLITAGVGDILGKYVCLADWRLSHIVTGEYFCEFVEGLVRESIQTVRDALAGIGERRKEAVEKLMEGLVLSGIAMSYIGNSRPASGSEHHLSHFWEVCFLKQGRHGAWHGTKVAVGTVVALKLYGLLEEIFTEMEEGDIQAGEFDQEGWEREMRRVYGSSAQSVIDLENSVHKNRPEEVKERLTYVKLYRKEILKTAAALPEPSELTALLIKLGAPYLPEQIDVDENLLRESILYAKEIRNRYGILQLLFDTGRLGRV